VLTYAVVDRFPLSYLKRAPLGSYSGSSSTRFGLEAFGTHVLVVLYSSRRSLFIISSRVNRP